MWNLLNPTRTSHLTQSESLSPYNVLQTLCGLTCFFPWPHLLSLPPSICSSHTVLPVLFCFFKRCSHAYKPGSPHESVPSVWSAFLSDTCIPHSFTSFKFCLNVIFSVNYCLLLCVNMQPALIPGFPFSFLPTYSNFTTSYVNVYGLLSQAILEYVCVSSLKLIFSKKGMKESKPKRKKENIYIKK